MSPAGFAALLLVLLGAGFAIFGAAAFHVIAPPYLGLGGLLLVSGCALAFVRGGGPLGVVVFGAVLIGSLVLLGATGHSAP